MGVFRIIALCLGLLGILDTMIIALRSNSNLGVWLPAILGIPLFLWAMFYPQLTRFFVSSNLGLWCKWIAYIGYGFVVFAFIAGSTLIYSFASHEPRDNLDALIVLGAGVRNDRPSLVLQYRLDAAIEYHEDNPNTLIIVSGGQGADETSSEASVMAKYLIENGVDESLCIEEDQAASTEENFAFSSKIIEEHLGTDASIGFVTTDFHVLRSSLVAHRQGLTVDALAADDVWYVSLNNALRECVALLAYYAFGRI